MATKNYTFPSDSSGGNDYQPDLTDTADIAVAFADFVEGIQSVFNSIGSDTSFIDNKLDGTTDLSIPASRFILQGTQSANNIKFAVTNTGSITLNLPPATTTIVGTDSSQTLTNKTLSAAIISGATTLTGTINASGATLNSPTISNPTISGSVNGNQDFNNNVNIDGTLTVAGSVTAGNTVVGTLQAGTTNVSSLTVNGSQIVGGYIPVPGMIVMYNGTTPPAGWAICNGTNGTPDLRDRFIIGAGSSFGLGAFGGGYGTGNAGDHNHNLPRFNGSFNTNESGAAHSHRSDPAGFDSGSAGSHSHNSTTGGSNANTTRDLGTGGGVATPAHTHNFNTGNAGSHTHNVNVPAFNSENASANHAHSGSFTTDELPVKVTASSPGNHTHTTDRPLFWALMYIMKL
jgi:hypothetical protein